MKKNILTLILSFFISILIIEISLRFFKIEYPIFQTHDFYRGFSLRPGASGWWLKEGSAYVEINNQGLRDQNYKKYKSENIFRIALLGDSFAEARSIPLKKTFWHLMEDNLNSCANIHKKIEVINFGVTEYSTAQELLTLRHNAWNYNPDLIILAFFSGNDIRDNSKILSNKKYRPFFIKKNNDIVLDNSFRKTKPYLILKSDLGKMAIKVSDYSRIAQLLKEIYVSIYLKKQILKQHKDLKFQKSENNDNKNLLNELGIDYNQVYNPTEKVWLDAWEITEYIIKKMNYEITEKNSKFVVVTVPTPLQVHPDEKIRKRFIKKNKVKSLSYPDNRITRLGQSENFLVINLAEKMKDHAEKNKIFFHGFDENSMGKGHWNLSGHEFASQIISKKLCRNF